MLIDTAICLRVWDTDLVLYARLAECIQSYIGHISLVRPQTITICPQMGGGISVVAQDDEGRGRYALSCDRLLIESSVKADVMVWRGSRVGDRDYQRLDRSLTDIWLGWDKIDKRQEYGG